MEQKWSYLVDEYRAMLYRIAFSNLKNRADAEDAVQEAFLRYIKDEKPIQNKEHEKAWLIRTTIHICLDILKSGWYRRTVPWNESFESAAKNIYLPCQVRDDQTLDAVLQLQTHYRNPIYLFITRTIRSARSRRSSMKRRGRLRRGCAGAERK